MLLTLEICEDFITDIKLYYIRMILFRLAMEKILQIMCMVTVLVTVTVSMTNAQGDVVSICKN